MALRRRLFLGLYACSGAAALVYEVTWTRLLTLQLGHTVAAASTVLAAFMGGLAAGAWIAGRADERLAGSNDAPARRLRCYAFLETVVAVAALLLPLGLTACAPALAWAYADGTAPFRFAAVRVALSLLLLGIPAAAMGATFPLAAAWFAGNAASGATAADAGALYAANTAGAAIGAIATGFWLIPAIGLRGSTSAGVLLNLLAAAGGLWLAAMPTTTPPSSRGERTERPPRKRAKQALSIAPSPSPRLAYAAAAISGFVALAYEVVWTRLLALVIGPTTYAFATMAAAFITGLAIGSAAGSRIARRSARPGTWLGAMLLLCAVAAAMAAWFAASRLPLIVAGEVTGPGVVFGAVVLRQALGIALLLLPMTFALGAAFPLALALTSAGASAVGRDVARLYTANTLGAIAGALAGGFLLVPLLGLRSTIQWCAIIGALYGGWCLAIPWRDTASQAGDDGHRRAASPRSPAGRGRPALVGAVAAAAAVALIVALPAWDRELLASGAYKYAPYLQPGDLDTVLRAGRLEYYKEGAAGTVSVRRLAGTRSLAIDGKVDASNAGDMLTQRLLGLLPVLLHPDPQDVCVIGLGSGVTVGSALSRSAVRHADVVEISPEVVEASRFFDHENNHALQAPGVRLIIGDGRSHLLLTPRRYDVIVSEPSNPWMAGVAALFTQEFFRAARARLKPDGLLCQWAHTYDISAGDLRSIVRTFGSVFPQGTLWLIGESDLLLIGTAGAAIGPHLDQLEAQWRRGAAPVALSEVGISGDGALFALLSLFAGGPHELVQFGDEAPIQTDDRMALEFSAPGAIYGRSTSANSDAIRQLSGPSNWPPAVRAAYTSATAASWMARGSMELNADAYDLAYDAFRKAGALDPRNTGALSGLSLAAAGARKQEDARDWLKSLAAADPGNVPVRLELSKLLASSGDFSAAAAVADEALRLSPDDARAGEQLASIFADAGDAARLEPLAEALTARFPARVDPRYYHATALFLKGQAHEAAVDARRFVADNPQHARGFNLLGAACATDGQRDCARTAFEMSIRLSPRDPSGYVNLGVFLINSGDPAAAADYFAEALTIDPASASARDGLTEARAAIARR
jgi:spermidine synthase